MSGRIPPQDLSAEQGVLGGCLLHGVDALATVAGRLDPGDFYHQRHGQIFKAMLALYEKNQPVDEITVTSWLQDAGKLEATGGALYLAQLSDTIPTQYFVEAYAGLVKDKSLLRDFIAVSAKATEEAYSRQAEARQIIEDAEAAIFAITERDFAGDVVAMADLIAPSIATIEARFRDKGQVSGVPSGFKRLDKMTMGWQPGELIILAARPSMGKTALALNMAGHAALSHGLPVLVFSLEMSREQLALRLLCAEGGVSGERVRSGFLHPDDFERLSRAAGLLHAAPLFIDDTPSISILELRAKARRTKKRAGLGLVVVDYLQLMRGPDGAERREQEVSAISRALKALAKELHVPVIALSQLNRKVEDRPGEKRPQLGDLRESGAIEQDADVIAFIYRKKVYKREHDPEEADDHLAEIILAKQRNGPTGTVKLAFLDDLTRFQDAQTEQEQ